MTAPSQMSLRRIPDDLHLSVRIAYSAAWEALIEAHKDQLLQFVCEFAPRVQPLEGIDLYFRVVAVPEAMQEPVRTRTLTALDVESLSPLVRLPPLAGWQRFRLDLILERLRYRRRQHEKTLELARMVGARAAEAIVATHVENAIGLIRLLKGVMPVNAAADHYLREFTLPASAANMVMQRVQARVAGDELTAQYDEPLPRPVEASDPMRLDGATAAPEPFPQHAGRAI